MTKSWMHHKGRNKHHFEYWIDYGINWDSLHQRRPNAARATSPDDYGYTSARPASPRGRLYHRAPYQYQKKESAYLWFPSISRHSCKAQVSAAHALGTRRAVTLSHPLLLSKGDRPQMHCSSRIHRLRRKRPSAESVPNPTH